MARSHPLPTQSVSRRQRICVFIAVILLFLAITLFALIRSENASSLLGNWTSFSTVPGSSQVSPELTGLLHPEDHIWREPKIIQHYWNITKGQRSPDGVIKPVYLINGEFPGPTIEARSGDTLSINISNQLPSNEGVAFHWHGLQMRGFNAMDGVVGVTQEAIPAGSEFTYEFNISETQSGTFWYHSHSELQRSDGLYGGLIVHRSVVPGGKSDSEQYGYEKEQLMLVGDWYHRSAEDVQASYSTYKSSGHEPVPDSVLINGHGAFTCSMAVPAFPVDCKQVPPPRVMIDSVKTRLRIVNIGALAGITLSIPDASLELIQLDGGNRVMSPPPTESVGVLYPGERMDIIVSNHHLKTLYITLDPENFTFQNQALTPTHQFPLIHPTIQVPSVQSTLPLPQNITHYDLSTAVGIALDKPLSEEPDQNIVIYTRIELLAEFDHIPLGFLNRTTWVPQSPPLISLPRTSWDSHQLMASIPSPAHWVDIFINNIDEKSHPFHLHGYDFFVLTQHAFGRKGGYRTYNPFDKPPEHMKYLYGELDLERPRKKDTVMVPAKGYVVLRILADNPGIWVLHCHILWHQAAGMAMGIVVGDV